METKPTKQSNPNMHYLWWLNQKTQKKFCAGRAFYLEKSGDYALYINLLENGSDEGRKESFYLRPVNLTHDCIYFKLEKVIQKDGKSMRFCIGEGFQSEKTSGEIHIHIEPLTNFDKKLVINLSEGRSHEA